MVGPKSEYFRYFGIVTLVLGVFTQFVACGAELYQISLEDDSPQINLTRAAKSPSDPSFGIHAIDGWQDLPIRFRTAVDLDASQVTAIENAMRTWEWAMGKTTGEVFSYVGIHNGMSGDRFKDLNSSLEDSINGHYFDNNWAKTGKKPLVIATTIWANEPGSQAAIATADIRYNTQVYILGDSFKAKSTTEKQVVDLESLALHEVGHLLGLEHIEPAIDGTSIMNPNLFVGEGLASRSLSRGDILRIQKIYGCEGLACDVDALMRSSVEARAPAPALPVAASKSQPGSNQGLEKQRY